MEIPIKAWSRCHKDHHKWKRSDSPCNTGCITVFRTRFKHMWPRAVNKVGRVIYIAFNWALMRMKIRPVLLFYIAFFLQAVWIPVTTNWVDILIIILDMITDLYDSWSNKCLRCRSFWMLHYWFDWILLSISSVKPLLLCSRVCKYVYSKHADICIYNIQLRLSCMLLVFLLISERISLCFIRSRKNSPDQWEETLHMWRFHSLVETVFTCLEKTDKKNWPWSALAVFSLCRILPRVWRKWAGIVWPYRL